jgi:hypothetical protein
MPLFFKQNAKIGFKIKETKEGFEAVPVLLKHLEHKLISILGRVNAFSFVVEDMHKR